MSKNDQFKFRIIEDFRNGKITRAEAALLLDRSERSITRLAAKVRLQGMEGVTHGNRKQTPANKVPEALEAQVVALIKTRYYDLNMLHLQEILADREGINVSYTALRRWCHRAGLVKHKKKIRPSKKRRFRERMGSEGLLLQMDGSHHKWNGKDWWCLIGMIDDATSDIPYAEFFHSEDTVNCMKVLEAVIAVRGVPEAIYVDKAGWFGGTKRQNFCQFERACNELDIRIIYAHSPEAKGRIERAWKTFQDRLIPELRLEGLSTLRSANGYLMQNFLPRYWQKRNRVEARNPKSRYREIPPSVDLGEIFCLKHHRTVRRNMTFQYGGSLYQITDRSVINLSGCRIEIREYRDGTWRVYRHRQRLEIKPLATPFKSRDKWQRGAS